jgi:GH25 family lysozyme M1 (1,4-beta-N-acetylmuramidase)
MEHKGALDWKANGGHPGNWFGVVTDTGEVTGNPLVQGDGDPFPGFYVSSSSLVDKGKKRGDPNRYVDARKVPYLAWPQQVWLEKGPRFTRVSQGPTGRIGDLMTAYNPKNGKVGHLIMADMGGYDDPHFGEGSPALGKLIDAYGHQEPDILYIVYPHSGADQGTIPSPDEIQQKGQKLFDEWGGVTEVQRVLPMIDSGGSAGAGGAPVAQPAPSDKPADTGSVADPIGDPKCDRCSGLQKLLDAGVADKIKRKGSDGKSIQLLQWHLVQFGYNLGASGPGKDGVDGDYGETTAKQLGAFLQEIGKPGNSDALSADAARLVLEKHKAGFKTTGPQKAKPQPEPDAEFVLGVDYFEPDLGGKKPDWSKATAKPGGNDAPLSFVFVQALEGRLDKQWPTFRTDWQAASDAGLLRGTYFFLSFPHSRKPGKPPSPEAQAKRFIEIAGEFTKTGANVDFPPGFDVEFPGAKLLDKDGKVVLDANGHAKDDPHEGWTFTGMTQKQIFEGILAAWQVLKDHYGAAPIIYTSARVWRDDLGDPSAPSSTPGLIESPLWLARYVNSTARDGAMFKGGKYNLPVQPAWGDATNWWIHQYHGDSPFPGFNQVSGMDRFHTMVKGAKGDRVKWVQRRLGIDQTGTYDDAEVDKVKQLQQSNGIDPANGVIGPRTFALLCWMNP